MTGRFEIAKGQTRDHLGDQDVMAMACAARLLDGNHEKRVDLVREIANDLLNLSDSTLTRLMNQLCGHWQQLPDPKNEKINLDDILKPKKPDTDDLPF